MIREFVAHAEWYMKRAESLDFHAGGIGNALESRVLPL
jgi:hypothetical protein